MAVWRLALWLGLSRVLRRWWLWLLSKAIGAVGCCQADVNGRCRSTVVGREVRRKVFNLFWCVDDWLFVSNVGKIRVYHTTKSFLISYSEDYALLVGNLSALAFCCRVETGGE